MSIDPKHQIILAYSPKDEYAGTIVRAALVRSFSSSQIITAKQIDDCRSFGAAVVINPSYDDAEITAHFRTNGKKLLLLGDMASKIAEQLQCEITESSKVQRREAELGADEIDGHRQSSASVVWANDHALTQKLQITQRPFIRSDFEDEWNNLGYGSITACGDPWSIACHAQIPEKNLLARIQVDGHDRGAFAALFENNQSAALWINRPVGLIDSFEWAVIETFLGDYRHEDLNCFPYMTDIPKGFDAAVTARLDCDEAITSARALVEFYRDHGFPLSLAVCTKTIQSAEDRQFLRWVADIGGAILSHSVNHLPNWGGQYQTAFEEAISSKATLEALSENVSPVKFAVCPFHQVSEYAASALRDANYQAFVSGSIAGDPAYTIGRSGIVPFTEPTIASHSQQCMLHGDIYRRQGNSMDVYISSFEQHVKTGGVFGYLDHPFSDRYQYGWDSESQRIEPHGNLLSRFKDQGRLWRPNLNDMLSFVTGKSQTKLATTDDGKLWIKQTPLQSNFQISVNWKQGRQL